MTGQDDGMPSTTFSPVSNAGLLMNWAPHQVLLGGLSLAWIVLPLTAGAPLFSLRNLPAALLLAISLITINGRSLWQLAGIRLGFGLRQATGRTRWTMSPMARDTTVGYLDLPGTAGKRLKPMEIVDTRFSGGAFIWDTASGEATVALRMTSLPFAFRPETEQAGRGREWGAALAQAVEMQGLARIVTQARSLRMPDPPREPARPCTWSGEQMLGMETDSMPDTVMHDMIVTITIRQQDVAAEARKAGGGVPGLSQVLKDRVVRFVGLAMRAGASARDISWLNAAQLRGLGKTLSDPSAWDLLDRWMQLDDGVPLSTSYAEYSDRLEVDRVTARTLWVDRWPADPVTAGFLSSLACRADMDCILTQVWKPKGERAARKALDNRVAELERIQGRNRSMGRNPDQRVQRELEETQARLRELAERHAEVDFQGFLTVIAPTREQADADVRRVTTDMGGVLHFDGLRGQQWAAWVGALPFGQAGR